MHIGTERPALKPEIQHERQTVEALPGSRELEGVLASELSRDVQDAQVLEVPNDTESNECDVAIEMYSNEPDPTADDVRQAYVEAKSKIASGSSWWNRFHESLVSHGVEREEAAAAMKFRRAYDFKVVTSDGIADGYELYECGDDSAVITEEEMSGVEEALKVIDQFSGGAILSDPNYRKIITTTVDVPHSNRPEAGVSGFASEAGTLINLHEVRRLANKTGVEVGVMLGVTLAHEILGHQLERMQSGGKTGQVFPEYFDYSPEKIAGRLFSQVHESVRPKRLGHDESQPVREYGGTSPAEDYATSTDAAVSEALGWDEKVASVEHLGSQPDPHRTNIILGAMDEVARRVGEGYAGSPVEFVETQQGLQVRPGRTLERVPVTREEVIVRETNALLDPYRGRDPIRYKREVPLL